VFGDRDSGRYLPVLLLDQDPAAQDGRGNGLSGRPEPFPLLGRPSQEAPPHAAERASPSSPGSVHRLRRNGLACQRATGLPSRVGTVVADHNDGDR
jgi:hypothetical protein